MTASRPPNGPRIRPITEPTWQRIAAGYAMVAAIPLLLWVVSVAAPATGWLTTHSSRGIAATIAQPAAMRCQVGSVIGRFRGPFGGLETVMMS